MDSSTSRRKLGNPPEELVERPTLQFIALMRQMLTEHAKTAKAIASGQDSAQAKEVIANMSIFGKAILNMDEKFLEYEKTHEPLVDIKYKERVMARQKRSRELETSLRSVPSEHERKTSEIEDKIKDLRVDRRDVNRGRVVTEVTDINIHTADVVDARDLQAQKRDATKKMKGVCCPCTEAGAAKVRKYSDLLDQINRDIALAALTTQNDKEVNKANRVNKEEKIKVFDQDIKELKSQRLEHISTPIVERIQEAEEVFSDAEESLERAKADLEDAELRALKNIGRAQLADLLHLVAQFGAFKQAVDSLYMAKRDALKTSRESDKDKLDSLMKKIAEFQVKLNADLHEIEEAFFKFSCSEAAARTGKAIYRAYEALDDNLKIEFVRNSFVDTAILDQVIKPVSTSIGAITPIQLAKVSDHPNTFHSKHSKRLREKTEETKSKEESVVAVSSSASPIQKRGSSNY